MNKKLCYLPTKLDRTISSILTSSPQYSAWTPEFVASLRGAYDDYLMENGYDTVKYEGDEFGHSPLWDLDTETEDFSTANQQVMNLVTIINTLKDFRTKMRDKQVESLKAINDNKAEIWDALSDAYGDNVGRFYNRASQVAYYYVKFIDQYLEIAKQRGDVLTRQDVINGIKMYDSKGNVLTNKAGNPIYEINSSMIFNAVFNKLMADYSDKMNKPHTEEEYNHMEVEYAKLFSPRVWAATVIMAKSMLKNIEGLKVGLMEDVADELDIDTLNDNDFVALFDPEASTREHWQTMVSCISAYGSLSKEVRRLLSNVFITYTPTNKDIAFVGDANHVYDDLGYPLRMNSVVAHQKIMDIMRNVRTKRKMLRKLSANIEFAELAKELKKNDDLAGKFFNDFRKIFQPYVQISIGWDSIKHQILNRTQSESAIGNWLFSIKYHPTKGAAATSRVKWEKTDVENMQKVFKNFDDRVHDIWTDKNMNYHIINALDLLGIEATSESLNTLLGNMKKKSDMIKALSGIAKYSGLNNIGKYSNDNFHHWITFNAKKGKSENQKKVEEIFKILEECGNGVVYEKKCRTIDSKGNTVTRYSYVRPNFLGDTLADIQAFSKADNAEEERDNRKEYKQWLKDNYFSSSQFCDEFDSNGNPKYEITDEGEVKVNGIHNYWLRELFIEANADEINKKIDAMNKQRGSSYQIEHVKDMFDTDSYTSQFSFMQVITGKINSRVLPFEGFTNKIHYQQMLASYFSMDTQANGVMSEYVFTPVFVLGDSGVCKILKTKRIGTVEDYRKNNGKFNTDLVVNELYNLFHSELKRMSLFKRFTEENEAKGIQTNKNIKNNINKFTMLTFLNDEFEGKEYTKLTESEVKAAINQYLEKAFESFKKIGESTGAISLSSNRAEAAKVNNKYGITKIKERGGKELTIDFNERLKEFYYNTYLASLLQYQMFTGDLGYYANVKDFQKRYKELHAPGDTVDTTAIDVWRTNKRISEDGMETAMYINDVGIDTEEINPAVMEVMLKTHAVASREEVIEATKQNVTNPKKWKGTESERQALLKKLLGDNLKIYQKLTKDKDGKLRTSRTDGQGYRSLEGFRKIMIMAHRWDARKEAMYREIERINEEVMGGRELTAKDIEDISKFKTVIMPMKPYMYTMEKYTMSDGTNDTLYIPVQHKYSEDILIPCLLPKDSKIRKVAEYLHTRKIDLLAADTCVKVGMWGQAAVDENNIDNSLAKAVIHKLDYKHYRIQSNQPEHINVERAIGTQIRKLVIGNMKMNKNYNYFNGKKFKIYDGDKMREGKGQDIVALYTSLIVANMMESFEKFKKSISNEKELSNILSSAIVNNDRYSLHQLLDIAVNYEEGKGFKFNTPFHEGAVEHDIMSMISSLYRKAVNKQAMQGGSLIQVSEWGIEHIEEEEEKTDKDSEETSKKKRRPLQLITDKSNDNILYAEIEIPFKFSYTDSKGNEVPLKFNDYCNTDGTFIKGLSGKPKIEEDFPGILDIIAYRIPSERAYSMLNCKVVRCSHPEAGGTIRVPAQCVEFAGFDFDFDKLYIIRKELRMKKKFNLDSYSSDEKWDIFSQIYEDRPDIVERLKEVQKSHPKLITKGNTTREAHLNEYWDDMIARNPSLEGNEEYDKNVQFERAARKLNKWKETEEREELIEYDFNKSVTKNSRVARNNLIFELMRQRLMDPETLKERITPGGFDSSKDSAREMRHLLYNPDVVIEEDDTVDLKKLEAMAKEKDYDKEYDAADPATLLFYNQLNQVAAKLIGVFANQNTNHQLSSLVRKLELTKPIQFDGMVEAKILETAEEGLSESDLEDITGSTLLAKKVQLSDGRVVDIDLNMAEFLAASVDAVKDPVLNYLNFNTTTAASGALLARLGYSTRDIGILFNQPIIKEVCTIIQNSGNVIQFHTAMQMALMKYTNQSRLPKNVDMSVSSESLAAQLVKFRDIESDVNAQNELIKNDKEFVDRQISTIAIFEQAYKASRELSKYISTTKFTASNAVGSTSGFFYNQMYTIHNYVNSKDKLLNIVVYKNASGTEVNQSLDISDKDMSDREAYIQMQAENPLAFEQCMYDLNKELLKSLSKYFPYDKPVYAQRRDAVARFVANEGILDPDTIDNVHRETTQHLLTSTDSAFNPNAICKEDPNYTNREYYLYKFPLELFRYAKFPLGTKSIPVIIDKYINFSYSDYKNEETGTVNKQVHIYINLNTEQEDKNTFMDAWAALAKGNEFNKKIALGLYFHNFYKLGFNVGPFSFMQFAPFEVKKLIDVEGMSYLDYISIENIAKLDSAAILEGRTPQYALEFAYQYILNHPENYTLLPRLPISVYGNNGKIDAYERLFKMGSNDTNTITLDLSGGSSPIVTYSKGVPNPVVEKFGWSNLKEREIDGDLYYDITNKLPEEVRKLKSIIDEKSFIEAVHNHLETSSEVILQNGEVLLSANVQETQQDTIMLGAEDKANIHKAFEAREDTNKQGTFTVSPIVMYKGKIYAAQVDGHWGNRTTTGKVTYKRVDVLGKKNTYNTYAKTLDEALRLAKEGNSVLKDIEESVDNDLQQELDKYKEEYEQQQAEQQALEKEEDLDFDTGEPLEDITAESQSSDFADNQPIDVDYDSLFEQMMECSKVNENMIINTMLDLIEESGRDIDREIAGQQLSMYLNTDANNILESRRRSGEKVSSYSEKMLRKEVMVESLISNLKTSIQSGRTEVYTSLKEKIC